MVRPKGGHRTVAVPLNTPLIKYLFDFEYIYPFRRYSPPNVEVERNRAKFRMFLAPKIFRGRAPKFWTGIIKFGLVLTTVQNFTPMGRRISEISR